MNIHFQGGNFIRPNQLQNQLQNRSTGPDDPKSVLAEDPLYTQVGFILKYIFTNYIKKHFLITIDLFYSKQMFTYPAFLPI